MFSNLDFTAMAKDPMAGQNGTVLSTSTFTTAYRLSTPMVRPKVKQIFEQAVVGNLIQLPSSSKDVLYPEVRPYLDKYDKGSGGAAAVERVKKIHKGFHRNGTWWQE
ncbi:4-hydroxyphenylacetate 3-hydroxylase C-terminal domain-containing protein [Bacillus sp. SD075]|uniref:4-hydroxyphenylacetate 3-hydroxylase C-terminal domain-containing protein n=1 Tax=Bacillus sp. SD075 TaxID=2781732 RepID=UPI002570E383|nr:4-hydroxyphenylacetate 3-hydroxylase C-terminal domain-containing protein [Bacillus sp. SD075]